MLGAGVPAFIGDPVAGGAGAVEEAGEIEGAGELGILEGAGVVGVPDGAGVLGVPDGAEWSAPLKRLASLQGQASSPSPTQGERGPWMITDAYSTCNDAPRCRRINAAESPPAAPLSALPLVR